MKPKHTIDNHGHGPAETWRPRLLLGSLAALVLLLVTGCASPGASENSEAWQYVPATGYPAVGGPAWGRI